MRTIIKTIIASFFLTVVPQAYSAGLTTVLAAETVWTQLKTGSYDAFIGSIAVDTKTPSTIYAGTDKLLILKSNDGGVHWTAVYSPDLSFVQEAPNLAVDPKNTSAVYAAFPYGGLLRSLDAGTEWSAFPACNGSYINSVIFSPTTSQTMYQVNMGICKTTNGGSSWQKLDFGPLDGWVKDLVIDPNSADTLYAYTYNMGGVIKKSVDGGVTWDITGDLIPPPVIPPCPDGASCWISVDPPYYSIQALVLSSSKPAVLYAGTTEGLFTSTNGGANWQETDTGITDKNVQAIVVDYTKPETIYAGTPSGVFVSFDGGQHWASMNSGLSGMNVIRLISAPITPSTIYALTASGAMYKGNPAVIVLAKIDSIGYDTLQAACTSAVDGNTILTREVNFVENVIFTNNVIALIGGYNPEFSDNESKYTTVVGSIIIRGGSLTVKNILIR